MNQSEGYFIVQASSMPEIFRKVAQAKRLLETGEETTVNGAAPFTNTKTRYGHFRICSMDGSSRSRPCCGMSRGYSQDCSTYWPAQG